MRVLAVRQPWASLIINGLKTIEVRSRPTNIRERVAIYASKTINKHVCYNSQGYLWNDDIHPDFLKTGVVLGTVEIDSSTTHPVASKRLFEMNFNQHLAPIEYLKDGGVHFWYLKDPIKFETPIPIKWPSTGSWAKIELPGVE